MMTKLDIFTFMVLQSVLISVVTSGPVLNENMKVERSLKTSGNLLEPRKASCRCIELNNKECNGSFRKSRQLEVVCPENHRYCCDDEGKEHPQATDKVIENISEAETNQTGQNQPPTRIRIRLPSEDVKPLKTENIVSSSNRLSKPQIKCNCKARDACEDKYTDYTFGFHCSYDKVHCCEPQDQIENEMTEKIGGRLIKVGNEIGGQSQKSGLAVAALPDDYQCQCAKGSECSKLGLGVVADVKDNLCPFELVKCCGVLITKKSDVTSDDNGGNESPWNTSLEDEFEGRGIGINIHGQPAFRQPIQLPVPKIPMNPKNITGGQTSGQNIHEGSDSIKQPAEIILSPPELPTHYHEVQSGIQSSSFFRQGVQRPPIHQYYGGVGPFTQENPAPVPYRTINVNGPPVVYRASERSRQPESQSLLESITNYFFG